MTWTFCATELVHLYKMLYINHSLNVNKQSDNTISISSQVKRDKVNLREVKVTGHSNYNLD